MKLTIKDKGAAMKAVDRLGGNQAKIRELQGENRKLRALFEEWAKAHPDEAFEGGTTEGRTESFAYWMEAAAPALKIQSHLTCEEVVAKLRGDGEMGAYVLTTFDADGIKADFGGSDRKRKSVEAFGLYFTQTAPHLKVGGIV